MVYYNCLILQPISWFILYRTTNRHVKFPQFSKESDISLTMAWVESCPQIEVSLPYAEDVIKLMQVRHTSILVILTRSSIHVFNQHSLLPISSYTRSEESLEKHGNNVDIQAKHMSVDTGQLQKLITSTLILQTDKSYIEIIQFSINYSKSLYEITKNDDLIQTGLPMTNSNKFSISEMIKSATKSIITGNNQNGVNLENIEQFQNLDDLTNYNIEYCKLIVIKVLKIGMGIENFWIKQNSHNLIIYNNINQRDNIKDNYFQIINISNYKNQIFQLSNLNWYNESPIRYIYYNHVNNYFLFLNQLSQLWYLKFDSNSNGDIEVIGHNLHTFVNHIDSFSISFNFQNDLFIINMNNKSKLFKIVDNTLIFLKNLPSTGKINWFPNGEYFTVINQHTNYWEIYTKFGNCLFNSQETYKELDKDSENQPFLKAFTIIVSGNSRVLYLIDQTKKLLYYINLLSISNGIFYDHEYIAIIEDKKFMKFPLLPKFKNIILKIENYNGNETLSKKCVNGKLNISCNKYNQFCITYGENISISTPYNTGGDIINQILWFNFKNYDVDLFNIVFHVWFEDYLILINRRPNDDFNVYEDYGSIAAIDEILVIDCRNSKYGNGGRNFKFDSDLILWKYDIKSITIKLMIKATQEGSKLVLITWDFRLIIFELNNNKLNPRDGKITGSTSSNQSYRLFINVNKTIQLSSIQNRFKMRDIKQIHLVQDHHYLFLINSGELYLLKNYQDSKNNIYDLIKININIEWIKLQSIKVNLVEFLYASSGDNLLIYSIQDLLDSKVNADELQTKPPIAIEIDNYVPLFITQDLDLIGIENVIINNGGVFLKNRVVHKLILNNIMEYDLIHEDIPNLKKYESYKYFDYCLELLLFKYLTEDNQLLSKLVKLIEFTGDESIYINCLRKIEVGYWKRFFQILNITPIQFMTRLIDHGNVELCYQYLIIYLNSKKEDDDSKNDTLTQTDKTTILKIITMLTNSQKWEWCFELCRFIKLLEPSGEFLTSIKLQLQEE